MTLLTVLLGADSYPARNLPPGVDARVRFQKLIERPRVPLQSVEQPTAEVDGFTETAFSFMTEAGERVPGILLSKTGTQGQRPVVIVLHGTGGSKLAMRPILQKLAVRGFLGVAIDGRFAGERAAGAKGSDAYRAAILETWRTGRGFPLYYDTAWDVVRLIDYLETRPDVDAKRIGAIGFSKGGTELYLAAAVDERLRAVVPCIGVQSFAWALEHDAWQSRVGTFQSAVDAAAQEAKVTAIDATFVRRFYDRVAPGIADKFDGPAMLPLIAPRPLLVINGDRDDRTPRPGLELCIAATRASYAKADAVENFTFLLQPDTAHKVTEAAEETALNWLTIQLKLPTTSRP